MKNKYCTIGLILLLFFTSYLIISQTTSSTLTLSHQATSSIFLSIRNYSNRIIASRLLSAAAAKNNDERIQSHPLNYGKIVLFYYSIVQIISTLININKVKYIPICLNARSPTMHGIHRSVYRVTATTTRCRRRTRHVRNESRAPLLSTFPSIGSMTSSPSLTGSIGAGFTCSPTSRSCGAPIWSFSSITMPACSIKAHSSSTSSIAALPTCDARVLIGQCVR